MEQTHTPDPDGPVAPAVLAGALDRLVQRAVLTRTQADAVLVEVRTGPGGALPGRRRVFAEIAGYLGAAFVVGATFLYLGQQWEGLGRGGRFAIVAVMALVLSASGLVVRLRAQAAGARWWSGRPHDEVRRRLASTLLTGAAGAAAFAVYIILKPEPRWYDSGAEDLAVWAASLTALVVTAAGYLAARSAAGQLGAAVAAFAVLAGSLALADVEGATAYGVGILSLGVLWAVLDWRGLLAERRFALAVAVTFGLIGAQTTVLQDSSGGTYLGYVLTALVSAVCFTGYAHTRDWVLLAGGVVGATLVVPEFLYDVTDKSFGASGVMLAAGLTLLASSLAGLRIRRATAGPPEDAGLQAGSPL